MNDVLFDWKIRDIERTANEAKNKLHEVDSLRRDVDSLEHSLREARTEVIWVRGELSACQDRLTRLEATVEAAIPVQ